MSPAVSVGMSFKDPGKYFALALKSLLAQTFTDWELVAIDDGSKDDSMSLISSLNDSRVRLFSGTTNRGLSVRSNELVQLARGKYFFHMDADDVMHPERLGRQYRYLQQCSPGTVVGSPAYSIDTNDRILGLKRVPEKQRFGFEARHSFINPTVAAHRQWFVANPYSEKQCYYRAQDAERWCRTTSYTRFVNLPDPLLFYREAGNMPLRKYLGTANGVIHIVHNQFRRPAVKYIFALARELARAGLGSAIYCNRPLQRVVCRLRCGSLSAAERETAEAILNSVRRKRLTDALPLKPSTQCGGLL